MKEQTKPLRIALVAGELSGDILGEGLVKALKRRFPDAIFEGIAGPRMQAAGCKTLFDMDELSVMGLVEVLGRLPPTKNTQTIGAAFIDNPPDVFIGIDAPDFNLRVEKPLKRRVLKQYNMLAHQCGRGAKRIHKISAATNLVLALLPFEKAFYDKHDVPCTFVGHTLADDIALEHDQTEARNQLGLAQTDKVLALLPGSRGSEVGLLSETYIETAADFKRKIQTLKLWCL